MRILLAPDAFKDCLSAPEVCRALEEGIVSACATAGVLSVPLQTAARARLLALPRGAVENCAYFS